MIKKIPIFCTVSLILIFAGLYIAVEHTLIVIEGERFQGEIDSFKYKEYHGQKGTPGGYSAYPRISFIDSEGKTQIKTAINKVFYFKKYQIGESVNIYYVNFSKKLVIDEFYSLWSQALLLIFLGVAICYFGKNMKLTKI